MSTAGGFRRLIPPPRRRPGLLTIIVRWRVEFASGTALIIAFVYVGGQFVLLTAATFAVLVLVLPAARSRCVRLLQAVVTPHRVRSGLIQAGVTDRAGRPPWITYAWVRGETVLVHVWLRSGTTPGDLRGAADVITSACGAAQVEITHRSARQDRAIVVVYRPRWGWPGR